MYKYEQMELLYNFSPYYAQQFDSVNWKTLSDIPKGNLPLAKKESSYLSFREA